ncbi:MAG: hypothetical protein JNK60_03655 [Acidobacteria bacterium]|nr:hypothetical protein [Acidobacteriota bacterium]
MKAALALSVCLTLSPVALAQTKVTPLGPPGARASAVFHSAAGDAVLVLGSVALSRGSGWKLLERPAGERVQRVDLWPDGTLFVQTEQGRVARWDESTGWVEREERIRVAGPTVEAASLIVLDRDARSVLVGGWEGLYLAVDGEEPVRLLLDSIHRVRRLSVEGLLTIEAEDRAWVVRDARRVARNGARSVRDVHSACGASLLGRRGERVLRSTDEGATWTDSGIALPAGPPVRALVAGCSAEGRSRLLSVDAQGGVSALDGDRWIPVLDAGPAPSVPIASEGAGGTWLVSGQDGVFRSDAAGRGFLPDLEGLPAQRVDRVLPTASGALWAAGPQGISRLSGGRWTFERGELEPSPAYSWTSLEEGLDGSPHAGPALLRWDGRIWQRISFIPSQFTFCRGEPDTIFAVSPFGWGRSTDGGVSFSIQGSSPPVRPPIARVARIPGPMGDRILMVSTTGAMFVTLRCSSQLESLGTIGDGSDITGMVSFSRTGRVFVVADREKGLLRLTPAGWIPARGAEGPATALAADEARPGIGYAATSRGLFKTVDSGATWWPLEGLSADARVSSIAVRGTTLFVGTDSGVHQVEQTAPTISSAHIIRRSGGLVLLVQGQGFDERATVDLEDGRVEAVLSRSERSITLRVSGNVLRMRFVAITNPNLEAARSAIVSSLSSVDPASD